MAYRRKQGTPKASTYEETRWPRSAEDDPRSAENDPSTPHSVSTHAIRASSAHRDSSLSSVYGESSFSSARGSSSSAQCSNGHGYRSTENKDETRTGFWGVLARKAKALLEDDHAARQLESCNGCHVRVSEKPNDNQFQRSRQSAEVQGKNDNPAIQKSLDVITSSFNYIGGRVGDALEETRKLNARRKEGSFDAASQASELRELLETKKELEAQLKTSRNVANAMAAKAKLLMRELKTVKADLAFSRERCTQLEDENKIHRESSKKGDHHEDDDLIGLQLETLLAEKARLANENSTYARENRFLREIVEYHQLTMQDVVYLNEGIEEVSEVYRFAVPSSSRSLSIGVHSTSTSQLKLKQPASALSSTTFSPRVTDASFALDNGIAAMQMQEHITDEDDDMINPDDPTLKKSLQGKLQ